MTGPDTPRRLHVERGDDPAVLSWITHHERLRASPPGPRTPPATSPLGALLATGALDAVLVRGDALATRRGPRTDWGEIVEATRAAVVSELDRLDGDGDHWLLHPTGDGPGPPPTATELQRVVDRAVGPVLAAHGGALTVVEVGATWVRLAPERACAGCSGAPGTLDAVAEALRGRYPGVIDVAIADGTPVPAPDPVVLPSRRTRPPRLRLPRSQGGGCH